MQTNWKRMRAPQANERVNKRTTVLYLYGVLIFILLIDVHTYTIHIFLPISCVISLYIVSERARANCMPMLVLPESMPFHEFVFVILKYKFKVKKIAIIHFQLEVPCNGTVFVTFRATHEKKINIKLFIYVVAIGIVYVRSLSPYTVLAAHCSRVALACVSVCIVKSNVLCHGSTMLVHLPCIFMLSHSLNSLLSEQAQLHVHTRNTTILCIYCK